MLQSMRQATKSWAARGVIIVLALSFGAFGINDVFTGGSRSAVATVGDVDVPTILFDRQFQRAYRAAGAYCLITTGLSGEKASTRTDGSIAVASWLAPPGMIQADPARQTRFSPSTSSSTAPLTQ